MERSLLHKQKQIVEDVMDMDYDCLEEATWEFLEQGDAGRQEIGGALSKIVGKCHGRSRDGLETQRRCRRRGRRKGRDSKNRSSLIAAAEKVL